MHVHTSHEIENFETFDEPQSSTDCQRIVQETLNYSAGRLLFIVKEK